MRNKTMHFRYLFFTFFLLMLLFSGGCKRTIEPITRTSFRLDTVVTITIYDSEDTSLLDGAMELCNYYENLLSRTRETSEIYQMNHGTRQEISDETAALLALALSYSEKTDGLFDPTIGPISSLWDFHAEDPKAPQDELIQKALPLVDYRNVTLSGNTVTFRKKGMMLDLGGIAKGYIADRIKDYLTEQGVTSAIINLGGNVLCIGSRPDGTPFQVGIQQPFEEGSSTDITPLQIRDQSVVTSGIYQRYFEADGIFYHHILDPKTGFPCENELASVTIICDQSADGDTLSTSCFLMGLEKGLAYVNDLEDVQAVFITKEGEVFYSDDFSK